VDASRGPLWRDAVAGLTALALVSAAVARARADDAEPDVDASPTIAAADVPAFDLLAAITVLRRVRYDDCGRHGSGLLEITFATTGEVRTVQLVNGTFSTPTFACIRERFMKARVSPFGPADATAEWHVEFEPTATVVASVPIASVAGPATTPAGVNWPLRVTGVLVGGLGAVLFTIGAFGLLFSVFATEAKRDGFLLVGGGGVVLGVPLMLAGSAMERAAMPRGVALAVIPGGGSLAWSLAF